MCLYGTHFTAGTGLGVAGRAFRERGRRALDGGGRRPGEHVAGAVVRAHRRINGQVGIESDLRYTAMRMDRLNNINKKI